MGDIYYTMNLAEVFEDLSARFIINLPEEELGATERIFFQVEQAYWFYEDFIRPSVDFAAHLPPYQFREFARDFSASCPFLSNISGRFDDLWSEFQAYKGSVPVCGAILISDQWDKVLLVRGYKGNSWSFPRGKINQGEDEFDCAVREVYEEVGFDVREHLAQYPVPGTNPKPSISMVSKDKNIRMFIVPNIPESATFQTQTRKEIGKIAWFFISDLSSGVAPKMYKIRPFINRLERWIDSVRSDRKPKRAKNKKEKAAAKGAVAKETTAKETTAKETTAKETTAKETTAKETKAKETKAKEITGKEATAKEASSGKAPSSKAAAQDKSLPQKPPVPSNDESSKKKKQKQKKAPAPRSHDEATPTDTTTAPETAPVPTVTKILKRPEIPAGGEDAPQQHKPTKSRSKNNKANKEPKPENNGNKEDMQLRVTAILKRPEGSQPGDPDLERKKEELLSATAQPHTPPLSPPGKGASEQPQKSAVEQPAPSPSSQPPEAPQDGTRTTPSPKGNLLSLLKSSKAPQPPATQANSDFTYEPRYSATSPSSSVDQLTNLLKAVKIPSSQDLLAKLVGSR